MYYKGYQIENDRDHVVVTAIDSVDQYQWTEDTVHDAMQAIDEELEAYGLNN